MAFAALGDRRRAWELLTIINPVRHGKWPEEIETYKVEPYVVAADVYAVSPHSGRGGWTWYTGSAGWMYRLILESLLGLRFEADKLRFKPCLPEDWEMFKVHYRYRETIYHITVRQTPVANNKISDETSVTIDDVEQQDKTIPLVDDRQEHYVEVRIHVTGGLGKVDCTLFWSPVGIQMSISKPDPVTLLNWLQRLDKKEGRLGKILFS